MAREIVDADLQKEVLDSDVPVLVDLWAPWCGPCRLLGPIMDQLSDELEGKAKVLKMNVDECPETASKYQVTSVPTVIIFDKGEVKETLVGVQPKPKYIESLGL